MPQFYPSLWRAQDREDSLARAVSACWALFWTWFGFACGVAECASFGDVLLQTVPGLLFLGAVALAWSFPRLGGPLLLALGIVLFGVYWNLASSQGAGPALITGAMLAVPPMIAGWLFCRKPEQA